MEGNKDYRRVARTFRRPCRNISSKSLYQSLKNMYGPGNFDVDVSYEISLRPIQELTHLSIQVEQNVFVVTIYES